MGQLMVGRILDVPDTRFRDHVRSDLVGRLPWLNLEVVVAVAVVVAAVEVVVVIVAIVGCVEFVASDLRIRSGWNCYGNAFD